MVKLLIIADDFTGALDTGIQFKEKGTLIYWLADGRICNFDILDEGIRVLIIDAETRHMTAEEAHKRVYQIVKSAVKSGVPCIYKKTDSGLRGNIGSELFATLAASGRKRLNFIPAYPLFGRTTINGIHYIDGCPVAQSVFGDDLYEPVRFSSVQKIIASQSAVQTHLMGTRTDGELPEGILIYDAVTDEDISQIARGLQGRDELHVLAGCAGFASVLSQLLGLQEDVSSLPAIESNLLFICGSINPITIQQMDEAEAHGAVRIRLTLEQKMETAWLDTPEGDRTLEQWRQQIEGAPYAILESTSSLEEETIQQYADRTDISKEEIRVRIAGSIGQILKRLIDKGLRRTMMVAGGDTLISFLEKMDINELSLLYEVFPGVVLSQIQYKGETLNLISKSGGFGGRSLLIDLVEMIRSSKKEELVIESL